MTPDQLRRFRRATKLAALSRSPNRNEAVLAARKAIDTFLGVVADRLPDVLPATYLNLPAQSWGLRLADLAARRTGSWYDRKGRRMIVFGGDRAKAATRLFISWRDSLQRESHVYIKSFTWGAADQPHPYHRRGRDNPIVRRLDWIDGVIDVLAGSPDGRTRHIKSPEDYRAGRRAAKRLPFA